MGFFSKIKEGLKKTKDAMMRQVEGVIHSFTKIDEDFLEEPAAAEDQGDRHHRSG